MGHVDPEAARAAVQPEPQDVLELVAHGRVVPVEVGLAGVKEVQVVLAGASVGLGDARPGRAAEVRLPVVWRQVAALPASVAEDEHLPGGRPGALGKGSGKEQVLVGAVVGYDVHEDLDAQAVCFGDEVVEVAKRPEERVHRAVVGNVVAGVALRGREEWRKPQGVDAQRGDLRQLEGNARQVTDAVAGGVPERAGVDLVNHRSAPPVIMRRGVVNGRFEPMVLCGRGALGKLRSLWHALYHSEENSKSGSVYFPAT